MSIHCRFKIPEQIEDTMKTPKYSIQVLPAHREKKQ